MYSKVVFYQILANILTKPSSVELPAAVLGFGVGLLGGFCIAGWSGGIKQPTYLWQALGFNTKGARR